MNSRPILAAIGALVLTACAGATGPTGAPTPAPTSGQTASPAATATLVTTSTPAVTATVAVTAAPPTTTGAGASPSPQISPSPAPPTPTQAPTVTATPVVTSTPVVTATPLATPGPVIIGPASLDAPDTIPADTVFNVNWIGPNKQGDYVTIVAKGKRKWNGEPYFYTYVGTPRQLTSPTTPGAYELWYVDGASSKKKARRPITVTDFVGSLSGPESVPAGTEFRVVWTGPSTPGDYITIEPVGASEWAGESYFNAHPYAASMLTAPLTAGAHELWYVAADKTVMLREPITVTPVTTSVSGPSSANRGATFTVSWTGPDATGDYITIVALGAPQGSYLSYAYTTNGSPVTLTAPGTVGQYELRYVYGGNKQVLANASIQVN